MADWSKPELESTYANFVDEINARDTDLAAQFNPTYAASQSNLVAGTVQWLGSANKWRIWNGSVWNDLSSLYAINISGNAATASALSSAPGSVLEVGRYFDFHSAANGYDYDVRLDAQAGASAGDGTLVITASNVAATKFTGALVGNATTATGADGSSFATKATAAEGKLIAQKSGQNPAYLYNNDSSWGLYSASGGMMASFDRATGKFNFNGNAATATSAANGGVTSVNGQTGAVTIATTDATKLPLTGGVLSGDLTTYRAGAPTTGVVFFGNSGARYLYFDGASYVMPGGDLVLNGRAVNAAINGKADAAHSHSGYLGTDIGFAAVGSFSFLTPKSLSSGSSILQGSTHAGSNLTHVRGNGDVSRMPPVTVAGTWRLLSATIVGISDASYSASYGLFQRIS